MCISLLQRQNARNGVLVLQGVGAGGRRRGRRQIRVEAVGRLAQAGRGRIQAVEAVGSR
jgi:hypothetical protein